MRIALVSLIAACTSSSPLVESGPQIELVTNPGGVPDHPLLQLTLTTWNHLAALHDVTTSGELEATLDGQPLVVDPATTGYFGNHGSYVASFVLPDARIALGATTSTITVTDQQTTWSVEVRDLMTNDLQAVGAMVANGNNTLVWPSAATPEPYTTIDSACIAIATRATACAKWDQPDPGVTIEKEHVVIELTGATGERFTAWGTRRVSPDSTGDGPAFFVSVIDRLDGAFE